MFKTKFGILNSFKTHSLELALQGQSRIYSQCLFSAASFSHIPNCYYSSSSTMHLGANCGYRCNFHVFKRIYITYALQMVVSVFITK